MFRWKKELEIANKPPKPVDKSRYNVPKEMPQARMRIDANGNVGISNTVDRFKTLYLAGGGGASGENDYSEVSCGGGGGWAGYSNQIIRENL